MDDKQKMRTRKTVHISFAIIFMLCVFGFKLLNDKSIISLILKVAGYTYGPLLGLFGFGILTKRKLNEKIVPFVCLTPPVIFYLIERFQSSFLGKYQIGIELLLLNGALTFLGLYLISHKDKQLPTTNTIAE